MSAYLLVIRDRDGKAVEMDIYSGESLTLGILYRAERAPRSYAAVEKPPYGEAKTRIIAHMLTDSAPWPAELQPYVDRLLAPFRHAVGLGRGGIVDAQLDEAGEVEQRTSIPASPRERPSGSAGVDGFVRLPCGEWITHFALEQARKSADAALSQHGLCLHYCAGPLIWDWVTFVVDRLPSRVDNSTDDAVAPGARDDEPAPNGCSELLAPLWSTEWPTEPGWYWTRRGNHRPEPAHVFIGGKDATAHVVWVVSGSFAYPGERCWSDLLWGPTIPEPTE